MLIFRAIIDQQQELGGGETLDQAVEESLGLAVDPVEIFAHQQQWLDLTFPDHQALERVQGTLAALWRVQVYKGAVLGHGVQEREQGRESILEGRVERQYLPRHLGPHGAGVVT